MVDTVKPDKVTETKIDAMNLRDRRKQEDEIEKEHRAWTDISAEEFDNMMAQVDHFFQNPQDDERGKEADEGWVADIVDSVFPLSPDMDTTDPDEIIIEDEPYVPQKRRAEEDEEEDEEASATDFQAKRGSKRRRRKIPVSKRKPVTFIPGSKRK